jgi:hypothetical protein
MISAASRRHHAAVRHDVLIGVEHVAFMHLIRLEPEPV